MKLIDITKTIKEDMIVYPTDPGVSITQFKSLKNANSCNVSSISFGTHTGTHIDAPLHILKNGKAVDKLKLQDLICKVLVVTVKEFFNKGLSKRKSLANTRGILFKGEGIINDSQARYLIDSGIRLVGTESMSIENSSDKSHPVHHLLLDKGIIIEGLNLKGVKSGYYRLICLPLKIKKGDGAPVRAILTYD